MKIMVKFKEYLSMVRNWIVKVKIKILVILAIFSILIMITIPIFSGRFFYLYSFSFADIKEYLSIVQAYFTIASSLAALTLGYFYFKNRKDFEKENSIKDRKRKRLEYILEELKVFDELVELILLMEIRNEDELNIKRNKIKRSFENVNILLDQNYKLLKIEDVQLKKIIEVNSFVDNNELIMNMKYKTLKSSELLQDTRDIYVEKMQEAKTVCFSLSE